jgi:FkbM family methyltransferase
MGKEHNLPFVTRILLYYSIHMPDHRGKWRLISLLKRLTPPLEQGQIDVERAHLKWSIDPTDYVQSQLFWYGSRDKWELYHLRRLLKPGAVIFDVGANFGYYSLVLAYFLQRCCTIYAFEPNPRSYQNLGHNISLNQMEDVIRPQCLGLSDCDGEASFIEPAGNTGASTLVPGHGVEVLTLDSFARINNLARVDLIKIDVEGMERSVLKGACHLIESAPAPMLLIEVHPHTQRRAGTSCYDLIQDIRDLGFNIYELRRDVLRPLQMVPTGDDYINVLCRRDNPIPCSKTGVIPHG